MSSKSVKSLLCLAIVYCVLSAFPLMAIETTGTILGTVKDQTGSILPGTTITVTNELTGLTRSTVTDDNGNYVLPLLPVGRYIITAELAGFKKYIQRGVVLEINQSARVDITLLVGEITETVTVEAGAVLVDTTTSTLGKVVEEVRMVQLPLNERNFLQLGLLQPGITPAISVSPIFSSPNPGGIASNFQVNGLRLQSNNFLLDGADNNEPFQGTAAAVPSPDTLQEFKILTNMYSAEFGRAGGAIVNVVTKSGTNRFRGTVYEFLRNNVLDARNFFSEETPLLIRNQFGATLGGPMVKDRSFFFASYEGFRLRQGVTKSASVPTPLERKGDFSQSLVKPFDFVSGRPFPNGVIPDDRINAVARRLLSFYPLPNRGINQFASTQTLTSNRDQFTIRIDHSLSKKQNLTGRYYFEDGFTVRPFQSTIFGVDVGVPGFPHRDDFRIQHLVLSDTITFSPTLLGELRFSFNRSRIFGLVPDFNIDPAQLGFRIPTTRPPNLPLITVAGFTTIGQNNEANAFRHNNIFQYQGSLTYTKARHTLKAGIDIRRTQINNQGDVVNPGSYLYIGIFTGNPFADFLLGNPILFLQGGGDSVRHWRASAYHFYLQDDFKLRPDLTLNFGLRYELDTPPIDRRDKVVAFRPGQRSSVRPETPAGLVFPGDPGISRSTIDTDKNNFAPRFGFAWDIFGDGKTSLRGGYGVFFDTIIGIVPNELSFNAPFYLVLALVPPPSFEDPYLGSNPFIPGPKGEFPVLPFSQFELVDADVRSPYVQQWNLTLQKQIAGDFLFEVGYVGTKGTKLIGTRNINSAIFIPGQSNPANVGLRRPFAPAFGPLFNYETVFNSNYHGLQLSLNKRLSKGYSLLAAYTLSKAIDLLSIPVNFQTTPGQATYPQNQNDLRAERGLAAFDVRHRFVINYIVDLPLFKGRGGALEKALGGWQLSGITTFQSGTPFTVLDTSDPALDGDPTDRPDLVGNPEGARTVEAWFNTAAFRPVPFGSGRLGNAGRNIVTGPGFNNFDVSLIKNFKIKEDVNVEFRAEFFNLFNHPNFDLPVNNIVSPDFGGVLNTKPNSERQLQFGLKLHF